MTTQPTRNIGIPQLMSRSMPNRRLLTMAPILPDKVARQIAIAFTFVGNISTTTLLNTMLPVAMKVENRHAITRFCDAVRKKYMEQPKIPAKTIVAT